MKLQPLLVQTLLLVHNYEPELSLICHICLNYMILASQNRIKQLHRILAANPAAIMLCFGLSSLQLCPSIHMLHLSVQAATDTGIKLLYKATVPDQSSCQVFKSTMCLGGRIRLRVHEVCMFAESMRREGRNKVGKRYEIYRQLFLKLQISTCCVHFQGFAFINFHHREDAARAIAGVSGFGYDHLILNVEWAK